MHQENADQIKILHFSSENCQFLQLKNLHIGM